MNAAQLTRLKVCIEDLPHLKPVLWCGFDAKQNKGLTELDCYNIIAAYILSVNRMIGGHQYAFMVYYPNNDVPFLPSLHFHFVIVSDVPIPSKVYRAARRRTHGWFHVQRYNPNKGAIPYMYSGHKEMRLIGDVFCRNGKKCRHKHIHREFKDAVEQMYQSATV